MAVLTNLLAIYYRTGWRGSWRLSDFLTSHLTSLHDIEIKVEGGILHADLRIGSARGILANPGSNSGEADVMRSFVSEDDVVYDIGAHFGFYTLLLSKQVGDNGKVYAFEPNPALLRSLRKTIASKANVRLLECGLADEEGTLDLYVPEDASMASLSDWTEGKAGDVLQINCRIEVIDGLIDSGRITPPSFIKCDVEGAELSVFSGGRKMFASAAPVVMFELNKRAARAFGHSTEDYRDFFLSLEGPNYKFFRVLKDGLEPMKDWNADYANVLAVPESRQV